MTYLKFCLFKTAFISKHEQLLSLLSGKPYHPMTDEYGVYVTPD